MGSIVLKTAWVGIGEMNMRAAAKTAASSESSQKHSHRRWCSAAAPPMPIRDAAGVQPQ